MLGATPTDTKYLTAPHLGYQATIKDLIVNLSIIDIRRVVGSLASRKTFQEEHMKNLTANTQELFVLNWYKCEYF